MSHQQINYQPTLSFCLIVQNEENHLAACLKSIEALANEIIVIDTGSHDQSVNIAKSCGAKVFHSPWQDDFSIARNAAISQARGDWIFFIDADERLLPESQDILSETLRRLHPTRHSHVPVIQVQIQNLNDLGKTRKIHYLARLFPRLPEFYYQGRIHEQLLHTANQAKHQRIAGIQLLHYGYMSQALETKNKAERNIRLLRLQIQEDPEQANWYSYLADSLCLLKSEQANQEALMQYLYSIQIWPEDQQNSPRFLVTLNKCLKHILETEGAPSTIRFAQNYLARNDLGPDFLFFSGEAYFIEKQRPEARQCFQRCLALAERPEKIKASYDQACLYDLPLARLTHLAYQDLQAGQSSAALDLIYYCEALLKLNKRALDGVPLGLFLMLALYKNNGASLASGLNYPHTEAEKGLVTTLQILNSERFNHPPDSIKQLFPAIGLNNVSDTDLQHIAELWQNADLKLRWALIGILFLAGFESQNPDTYTCLADLLQSIGQTDLAKKLVLLLSHDQ